MAGTWSKSVSFLMGLVGALFISLTPASADATCVKTVDNSGVQTQTLFAGQSIDAGTVSARVDGSSLLVTYTTTGGWQLTEAHAWAGRSLAAMPQTNSGNPKVGNFPYQSGSITGATSYTFTMPLSAIGFTQNADGTCEEQIFYLAAHAALRKSDGNGGYQTETGWANGPRIVQRGNWATYFSFVLTCDCDFGGGGEECETMFAYGGSFAQCFLGLDLNNDGNGDFSRWGWTNGPLASGSYTFTLYAGAGQCNLSHGTAVGTLTVDYDGVSAGVSYDMNPGFVMEETHLYIGSQILPRDVNGEYTVAPGRFPYKHDLNRAASDSFMVGGLSGHVNVVAHGVVCGQF